MAEITSGSMLTVIVMDEDESAALQYILRRGVESLAAEDGNLNGMVAFANVFESLESFDIEA